MIKKTVFPLAVGLLLPLSALAAQQPQYSYLQGDFVVNGEVDVGPANEDYDGWELGGSVGLTPQLFVAGEYSNLEVDSSNDDVERSYVGLGLHGPLTTTAQPTDVYAMVSYERLDFGSEDADGFGLSAGLRWLPLPQAEVNPYVGYVDYGDIGSIDLNGLRLGVKGLYKITDQVALLAGYQTMQLEDLDLEEEITLGARVYFDI
ncbi:MAG: hypothetical protein L0H19_03200 [Salinisphaera sp.]|nr:hypothetical protein [Salinisphaera sp.]MDN5940042.1 hypothetical protein [Salinisphaera sp.]